MLTIDYTLHIGDEKLVRDTSPRELTMESKHWLYHWYKREGSTTSWIRGLAVFIMLQSAFVFPPCSLYAMATNGIGTVNIAVRDVHRGTELEKLKKNDTVVLNETVSTGSQSAVRIELLDGSILSMGELSSIVLDSIVYNTNRGVVEGVFTLTSGFLNFKSDLISLSDLICDSVKLKSKDL